MDETPRPTRWQKAMADTTWFRFKREVAVGLAATPFALISLRLFGSKDGAVDELIVILASALVAMVLLPFAEFAWNWSQAPMRLLVDDVAALRREVAARPAAPPTAPVEPTKRAADPQRARLEILRRIENELRVLKRGAERALEAERSSLFKKDVTNWTGLTTGSGDGWTLAGVADWQPLYERLREVYETVEDTPSGVSSRLLSGQEEALKKLVPQLNAALDMLRREIKKTVGGPS